MMGLPTETFFMMMVKMMWFRDVVGLVVKGLLFGALPAAICCYEGLGPGASEDEPRAEASARSHPTHGLAPPWSTPVFRATCLVIVRHSDHEFELVHSGVSRGPLLRPDAAGAARAHEDGWAATIASDQKVPGREPG